MHKEPHDLSKIDKKSKICLQNEQSKPFSTKQCPTTSTAPAENILQLSESMEVVDKDTTELKKYEELMVNLELLSDDELEIVSATTDDCISPGQGGEDTFMVRLNNSVKEYIDKNECTTALLLCNGNLLLQQVLHDEDPHVDVANVLKMVAVIHKKKKEYETATKILTEALELYEKLLGDLHPNYPKTLSNLAVLHQKCGMFASSFKLSTQALLLQELLYGVRNPNIIKQLYNEAVSYHREGAYNAAEERYARALQIYENESLSNDQIMAQIKHNLACCYWKQGKQDQAAALSLL